MAHWLKGQLLLNLEQYTLAKAELEQASLHMKRANFLPLQSEISKSLAEAVIPQKDFQLIRQYLYQAASEARLAERPVLEIRAYTLLSIRAAKLKLHEEKYDYLFRAKKLIADYQLDDSHFMLVFYHFALFAKDKAEQEKFYKKVLEQPVTPENYWVFFSASQFLAEIYGERQQWQDALELTNNIYEPARQAFLRAKIYQAKGDIENASAQAKIAFNSARTQHIHWIGLEMALILLQLENNRQLNSADALMYRRYIHSNYRDWWAQRNQEQLQAAGIELNPYGQRDEL